MNWGYTELRRPFDNWHLPEVRELFAEMVAIKKIGYGHNYHHLMPVGTIDFVSDHYMLWKMIEGKKVYISALRSTTLDATKEYNLTCPCLDLILSIGKVADINKHLDVYQRFLQMYSQDLEGVRYFSGWTTDPKHRQKDELGRFYQFAALATLALSHREYQAKIALVSGMPHVKTDQLLTDMGYQVWQHEGQPLDALPSPNYNMRPALFMYCLSHRPEYLERLSFIQKQWDERDIHGELPQKHQKEAA